MLLESYNFPTVAPVGWEIPNLGTTGPVLWEASVPDVSITDLLSETGLVELYPWQRVEITSTVTVTLDVYKPESIDTLLRYYLPHRNLGSWQLIGDPPSTLVVERLEARNEGYLNYLQQAISVTRTFSPAYVFSGGGAPTEGRVDQCSLYLNPVFAGLLPPYTLSLSYYPANVDAVSDALLRTTGQVSPIPISDFLPGTLVGGIKRMGFYLNRGASIINLSAELVAIPGALALSAEKQYLPITCSPPPGTTIDCAAEFSDFIAANPDSFTTQGACEIVYGPGGCAESTWTCSDGVTVTPYWRGIGG